MSEIVWYLPFSDWLISLSKMFSRSSHAVSKGKIFLKGEIQFLIGQRSNRKDFNYFIIIFHCCAITVVPISPPLISPALLTSTYTFNPLPHSHCLCPWVLHTCSLMVHRLSPPLSSLPSRYCQFVLYFPHLWLYFACLFVLLIRFHL